MAILVTIPNVVLPFSGVYSLSTGPVSNTIWVGDIAVQSSQTSLRDRVYYNANLSGLSIESTAGIRLIFDHDFSAGSVEDFVANCKRSNLTFRYWSDLGSVTDLNESSVYNLTIDDLDISSSGGKDYIDLQSVSQYPFDEYRSITVGGINLFYVEPGVYSRSNVQLGSRLYNIYTTFDESTNASSIRFETTESVDAAIRPIGQFLLDWVSAGVGKLDVVIQMTVN